MPKELHIVPNERVDLDDFKYGTSTFTVDSLRNHVHRLMSGDYRGGFVLEGFRIEITDTLGEIVVHNGIAIDRFGRLITAEDEPFTKNTDLQQQHTFTLPGIGTVNHFVMVEFELADADLKQRVVWDPTFPNPDIVDSDNDLVPTPKGKEFSIDIPVRRAKLWKIVTSTVVGFTDSTDPNTVRIPIAVVPVHTTNGVNFPTTEYDPARSTVMVKPGTTGQSTLTVADSRIFNDNAVLQILDYRTGTPRTFTVAGVPGQTDIPYAFNDRDNNILEALTVDAGMLNVEIGDVVVSLNTAIYLKEGSSYDYRPMFFSFSDPTSATEVPLATDEQETRNLRFESGQSLLVKKDVGTVPWDITTPYPSGAATHQRVVREFPERVENRLKQKQDFFRALGAIVREIKYGDEYEVLGNVSIVTYGSTPFVNTLHEFGCLITTANLPLPGGFSTDLIGATLLFTSGVNNTLSAPIVNVSAPVGSNATAQEYIIDMGNPGFADPAPGDSFTITKNVDSNTKYVDNYKTGTLNEVYRARIDRISNTWSNDLQERLRVNKVPIVTVGDGYKSFGDYNGNTGLLQAFNDVHALDDGGIIYVKRGNYTLTNAGAVSLTSNTVLMGEGPGITNIVYGDEATFLVLNTQSGSTDIENIFIRDISITADDISDVNTDGKGNIFTTGTALGTYSNIQIDNVHFRGGAAYNGGAASPGITAYYIGFIGSANSLSKNIIIKDSTFDVEGGGLYLYGCKNIKIHGCTFQTESDDFTFVGLSTGIYIEGEKAGLTSLHYGSADVTKALGEVDISDCSFLGKQTNQGAYNIPTTGWIFTTPNYYGSPVSVSGCRFVGDRVGLLLPGVAAKPIEKISIQDGGGIHNASETTLTVKGCLFHSYNLPLTVAGGIVTVEATDFIESGNGIIVGNDTSVSLWDYAELDLAYSLAADMTLSVMGCNFYGKNDSSTLFTGIHLYRNDDSSFFKDVTVTGCNFLGLRYAIDATDLDSYAASAAILNQQYDSLKITNNTFTEIKQAVFFSAGLTNASTEPVRSWAIRRLYYRNNTHDSCGNSINAINTALINFAAPFIEVDSNSFNFCRLEGGTTTSPNRILYFEGGFEVGKITNNSFSECFNIAGTVNTIEISVSGDAQQMYINNNIISTNPVSLAAATNAVQNGILFNTYVNTLTTNYNSIGLELIGNKFEPRNPNFVVLASQDSGDTPLDEQWEWAHVMAQDNYLHAQVTSFANFDDYSNSAQYTVVLNDGFPIVSYTVFENFLGASASNVPASSTFVALLDLRRFRNGDDNSATISNNHFQIDNSLWEELSDDYDRHTMVGCRFSKWPDTTIISNNMFIYAPLFVRYCYKSPRDNDTFQQVVESQISITGNAFRSARQYSSKTLVDIVPATGFAGKAAQNGASAEESFNYVKLVFADNQIEGSSDSLDGATLADQSSVVRFWHLNSHTILSAASQAAMVLLNTVWRSWYNDYTDPADPEFSTTLKGLASEGLMYNWQTHHNKLTNSFFYIDSTNNGDALGLIATTPLAFNPTTILQTTVLNGDATVTVNDATGWPGAGTIRIYGITPFTGTITYDYTVIGPAGLFFLITLDPGPPVLATRVDIAGSVVENITVTQTYNNYGLAIFEGNSKFFKNLSHNGNSLFGVAVSYGVSMELTFPLIVQNNAGQAGLNYVVTAASGSDLF